MEELNDLKSEITKSLLFLLIILVLFGVLKYLDASSNFLINLV